MNIILVPGLGASTWTLAPLRERLEAEGFECYWPGFETQSGIHGELDKLARTLREVGPAVVVGHSLGGLQGLLLALADNPHLLGIIGLGTPYTGWAHPRTPYFEARSLTDGLLPLWGPTELKRFLTLHVLLAFDGGVHNWIVEKLRSIQEGVGG